MQLPTEMEHYKSDIEDHEYQIKRYQRFNLKPNRENMGSVSKSRRCPKQYKPTEQEDRQFQRPEDVLVEAVAHNHIGECDQCHYPKDNRDQSLFYAVCERSSTIHPRVSLLNSKGQDGCPPTSLNLASGVERLCCPDHVVANIVGKLIPEWMVFGAYYAASETLALISANLNLPSSYLC